MVHAGLNESGGFVAPVAKYLSKKYGYRAEAAEADLARVAGVLKMLSQKLKAQHAKGSRYLIGDSLTAVDIYSAVAMALFKPLPKKFAR
jgi:glutathione S-transferase